MMRPACAYPSVIQSGLSNCPDLYGGDREGFGYGILSNHPSVSIPSSQAIYRVAVTGSAGPVGATGGADAQGFQSHQQSSFTVQTYPQIPLQSQFSSSLPADALQAGQIGHTFQPQHYQTVMTANGDKVIASNMSPSNYSRGCGAPNGCTNQPQVVPMSSSYGTPVVGSNTIVHVPHSQRLSTGTSGSGSRGAPSAQAVIRPGGTRSALGMPESNGFSIQPLYASYPTGAHSGGGPTLQVPYSMGISNTGIPVTMSPMMTKQPMSSATGYGHNSSLAAQNINGPTSGRASSCSSASPGMQQSPVYGSQPRLPNVSIAYTPSGYIAQAYPSSLTFRPGTNGIPGSASSVSMVPRPQTASSPQLNKDLSGASCIGFQSQSPQLPVCSSIPSCGSPNPCSQYPNSCKVLRSGSTGSSGPVFNSLQIGPNAAVTPPGSGIMNGPVQSMGQSTMMGSINGCLGVGSEGDHKPGACLIEGCYVQNRPMSSGTRDLSVAPLAANGPLGSGCDLLISPTFQMSNAMSHSASIAYANSQQVPVLPSDFDSLTSNPSPMMMMAMPASPVPGGTLINGPIPTGIMNVGITGSAPAPPPYHQSVSMPNCRSIGPSVFFGQSPVGTPLNPNPPLSDAGLNSERHFLGIPGDGMTVIAGGKQSQTGSGKSSARPKRTRANKAAGGGRGSKTNSKKTAATTPCSSTLSTPCVTDPYAMNMRMALQQPTRHKVPSWNNCPSTVGTHFPSGLTSPPMSLSLSNDSRLSCVSPASFSSSSSAPMRPNSGSPLNPTYTSGNLPPTTSHLLSNGPADPVSGLSNSPRLHTSVPSQQYLNSPAPVTSTCGGGIFFSGQNNIPQMSGIILPPGAPATHGQPTHPGNLSAPSSRLPASSMSFQPSTIQTSSAQSAARTFSQLPLVSGPGTLQSCEPTDRMNGPIYSSPAPPGETSMVNFATDTDRLVCPITNGMVWGPMQIQLNDVLNQFLPDGVHVRRFEFDLTANHLNTIVGRSDLDIVVCSHLLSEPLQVCHWPSDAVQIRFNEYLLRLDRSSVNGGESAHKVACVKQLCHPGRNQLEIAIVGLGEDPTHPVNVSKRRVTAAALESHRFAAFMAHMPALNVLLDGLKRRRPAGVNVLCDLLEGRAPPFAELDRTSPPNRTTQVIAELNLICPVFRTRMTVPGRITGCEHVEAFDMEAFLRREVLWPRLNCPICGHKSPAGLDGLCIDTTILYATRLVHPSVESILVRSDGYWRLPPSVCSDLPPDSDHWQPILGPLPENVLRALSSMLLPVNRELRSAVSVSSADQPKGIAHVDVPPTHLKQSAEDGSVAVNSRCGSVSIPSLTPCKESSSSPWTVSSESPAALDKTGGSMSDTRQSECAADPSVEITLRPSSQPVSWRDSHVPSKFNDISTAPLAPQSANVIDGSILSSSLALSSDCRSLPSHLATSATDLPEIQSHVETVSPTVSDDGNSSHRSLLDTAQPSTFLYEEVEPSHCTSEALTTGLPCQLSRPISVIHSSEHNSPRAQATPLNSSSSFLASPSMESHFDSIKVTTEAKPTLVTTSDNPSSPNSPCRQAPLASESHHISSCLEDNLGPGNGSHSPVPMSISTSVRTCQESTRSSEWNSSDRIDWRPMEFKSDEIVKGTRENGFNKKAPGSLKLGLDFLLAKEHCLTEQHTSSAVGPLSSGAVTVVSTSNRPPGTAVKPLASPDDHFPCSSNSCSDSTPVTGPCMTDHQSSEKVQNVPDQCMVPSTDNISCTKRIKLDPDLNDLNLIVSSSNIDTRESKLPSTDTKLLPLENSNDLRNVTYDGSSIRSPRPTSPRALQKEFNHKPDEKTLSDIRPRTSLSLISSHYDDDRLCPDSILSLSAQIDRIENFLDESYVRYVESFPCT